MVLIVAMGSNEDHVWLVVNRCPHQQYLGQMNLLPNPCVGTPWVQGVEGQGTWKWCLTPTAPQLGNSQGACLWFNVIHDTHFEIPDEGSGDNIGLLM